MADTHGTGGEGQGSYQLSAIGYQPTAVPCPQRRYEWFIAGTEPTEVDRSHVEVAVDARTGRPADASTPPQYVQRADDLAAAAGVRCVGTGE